MTGGPAGELSARRVLVAVPVRGVWSRVVRAASVPS